MKPSELPMLDPKILNTRSFKDEFLRCCRLHPKSLQVVVPFIGKIVMPRIDKTNWGSIVDFAKMLADMECKFCLTTLSPKDNGSNRVSREDAKNLSIAGVDLRFMPDSRLHSKLYQFSFREGGKSAFVGSANFSRKGFEGNVETVAFFRSKADNARVANEIRQISVHGHPYYPSLKVKP